MQIYKKQWTLGHVLDEVEGKAFIAASPYKTDDVNYDVPCIVGLGDSISDLPTEFFNNELMEIDPNRANDFEIFEFSKKYGLLYHPIRFSGLGFFNLENPFSNYRDAVNETDCINDLLKRDGNYASLWSMTSGVVSLFEFRCALRDLQQSVKLIRDLASDSLSPFAGDSYIFMVEASANSGYTLLNPEHRVGLFPYSLTEAISCQIIETARKCDEWRPCPVCGKPFAYQSDSGKKQPPKTDKKPNDRIYCSLKCGQKMKDIVRGKSPFPPNWDDARILKFVEDHPKSIAKLPRHLKNITK